MTSTIAGRGARRPPLLGALGALAMLACSTAPPALEPTAASARTRRVALCPRPGELVQVELCHATTAGAQAVLDLDLWCGERTGGTWFLRGDAGLGSACSGAHSSPIGGVLLGVARPGALASLADEYQPYWGRPLVLTPRLRGAPSFADDRLRVEEILGDVRLQDPSNRFELTMLPAADGSVLVTRLEIHGSSVLLPGRALTDAELETVLGTATLRADTLDLPPSCLPLSPRLLAVVQPSTVVLHQGREPCDAALANARVATSHGATALLVAPGEALPRTVVLGEHEPTAEEGGTGGGGDGVNL